MKISKNAGFTIVELLIVIVVIAILASVSVVAYNGVKMRANNSARNSEVANVMRLLELYKANYGDYPGVPWVSQGTTSQAFCIGTNFPNTNTCRDNNGAWISAYATDINDKLSLVGKTPSQHFPTDAGNVGPSVLIWGGGYGFTFTVWSEGSSAKDCPSQVPELWWDDPNSNTILCGKNFAFQSRDGA